MICELLGTEKFLAPPIGDGGDEARICRGIRDAAPTRGFAWFLAVFLAAALAAGCGGDESSRPLLTVEAPLHLEDHLDAATVTGGETPGSVPDPVAWDFREAQPAWVALKPVGPWEAVEMVRVDDALRLGLTEASRADERRLAGLVYVDVPGWNLEDWAYVEVRARGEGPLGNIGLAFNLDDTNPDLFPVGRFGDRAPLVPNGTVQTYRLSLDGAGMRGWGGPWTHLGIWFDSRDDEDAVSLDLLSVRVVPHESEFAGEVAGVRSEQRGASSGSARYRRTMYTRTGGSVSYRIRVPDQGRLDVGLGVLRDDTPVRFAITATPASGGVDTLLEETYADRGHWGQRSVDLSHLAGQEISLSLAAAAERSGTIALWGAPTLTGSRATERPNVIFYVIDGAGADYMSLYGYNRRTTPNLERLAAEGSVFERAYSNSGWTRPSTASFMTSLQHSVLGGFDPRGLNVVPANATTLAQHMHRAGYQTAVFTPNPNAGRLSGLDRGVDLHREDWGTADVSPVEGPRGDSSEALHRAFWDWRAEYPGEPYWAHFQTIDVHDPQTAPAPFTGLFISLDRREMFDSWDESDDLPWPPGVEYATAARDLYDESMAYQDHQIGRLVARLEAAGEWERTILIVAADHGVAAGSQDWGILMLDPPPPNYDFAQWGTPLLRTGVSRIPLMVIWPQRLTGGQRFDSPVSMIDVLPTILDLVDLPMPEVLQGQSLAPLLRGEPGWEPRPVILDEFAVNADTGELGGRIEVIDGRWGASLQVGPTPDRTVTGWRIPTSSDRPVPLLLFDLWADPMAVDSLHEERPDLVEKYTLFLEAQFEAHRALATRFTPGAETALTPEQVRSLRALGYIR